MMNLNQLISATQYMWGYDAKVFNTKVKGIYDTRTARHGGYLVDINIHPELKKYGATTNNSSIRAFEEDYEAMKVIWLYPSLANNKEWYDNLEIDEVVCYESDSRFKREFPHKGGIETNTINIIKLFCVQLIHQYDLNIKTGKDEKEKEVFKIEDLQNHKFANIEESEFHNLADVIEGLDIYHEEYIFNSLDRRKDKEEEIKNDDWDLIASRFLKSDKIHDILQQVYPSNFDKINKEEVSKELKDILDKEEFPLLYYYIEKSEELFESIPYDTLKEYETSLHLYYETNDIIRDGDELYSKTDAYFNKNIIKLSEDVIEFDIFLENENIKTSENIETIEI